MKNKSISEVITLPQFDKIPFLDHGFGTGTFQEKSFSQMEEWRNFKLLFLEQVHSDIVHFIESKPEKSLTGDAMVTRLPFIFLIIRTADCLPILLVDENKRVIAAVHCGWKGTARKVLEKVVRGMEERFGSDPAGLLAGFGPCIGGECYEVGEDVPRSFLEGGFPDSFFRPHPQDIKKYFLDLREANRLELLRLGVKRKNIFEVGLCTHCRPDFPSFRRDKEGAGRLLSFIGLSR